MSWFNDDDPDAPRRRIWDHSDPFRDFRQYQQGYADTSGLRDPPRSLGEIDPLPPPARPQRVEPTEAPEPTPFIELFVTVDDGVPLEGVRVRIADDFGGEFEITTDTDGHARTDVKIQGSHAVNLVEPIDLAKIARADEPKPVTNAVPIAPHDTSSVRIGTGATTICVVRPIATIVSLDGWREGQAVLVFGTAREQIVGATTIRGILRTAIAKAGNGTRFQIFVVGHADTKGGQDDNAALASERATSVALYLTGVRDAWAQHAYDNANMTTLKAALAWAAFAFTMDCAPGQIGPGWKKETAEALDKFRSSVGIPLGAKYGPADWAAIYDLYDLHLSQILYLSVADLQKRKQALRLSDDECGERWPVDEPKRDNHASSSNRRVDVVFVDEHSVPQKSIDEIYDGTFGRTHLDVGPEATVKFRAVLRGLAPVPAAIMILQLGACRGEFVADETGLVTCTAIVGEPYRIVDCRDLWGSNRFLWGITPDMLPSLASAGQ